MKRKREVSGVNLRSLLSATPVLEALYANLSVADVWQFMVAMGVDGVFRIGDALRMGRNVHGFLKEWVPEPAKLLSVLDGSTSVLYGFPIMKFIGWNDRGPADEKAASFTAIKIAVSSVAAESLREVFRGWDVTWCSGRVVGLDEQSVIEEYDVWWEEVLEMIALGEVGTWDGGMKTYGQVIRRGVVAELSVTFGDGRIVDVTVFTPGTDLLLRAAAFSTELCFITNSRVTTVYPRACFKTLDVWQLREKIEWYEGLDARLQVQWTGSEEMGRGARWRWLRDPTAQENWTMRLLYDDHCLSFRYTGALSPPGDSLPPSLFRMEKHTSRDCCVFPPSEDDDDDVNAIWLTSDFPNYVSDCRGECLVLH